VSQREYKLYDILVYHDFDSFVEPEPGMNGKELGFDADLSVAAIGPPIHEGRAATVVLAARSSMPEVQAFLERAERKKD
jgi:hypothetical protein